MATVTIVNHAPFVRKFSVFTLAWPPSGALHITSEEAVYAMQNSPDYQKRIEAGYLLHSGQDRKGLLIIRNTQPTIVRLRIPRLALRPGENVVEEALLDRIFSEDENVLRIFMGLRNQPDGLSFSFTDALNQKYDPEKYRDELVQIGRKHFDHTTEPEKPDQEIPPKTESDLPPML